MNGQQILFRPYFIISKMVNDQTPMQNGDGIWDSLIQCIRNCFASSQQQENNQSIQKKSTISQQNKQSQKPPIAIEIKVLTITPQIQNKKSDILSEISIVLDGNKGDMNVKIRRKVLRGMMNLGNTCYMNAATQCLLNLKGFNQQLENLPLNDYQSPTHSKTPPQLTEQYLNLLKQLYLQPNNTPKHNQYQSQPPLDLTKFKHCIETKNPIFKGYHQHDAHQILTTILEGINKEISRIQKPPKYKRLPNTINDQYTTVLQLSRQWQQYQKLRSDSIVYDTFHAQNLSVIRCLQCNLSTFSFNSLLSLQVSIPNISKQETFSVQELINQQFGKTKIIQGYYCNNCKIVTTCQDRNWMFTLPEVMVVHLKRFKQEPNGMEKITSSIKISDRLNFNQVLHPESKSKDRCQYILTGIIHHAGNLKSGHYTASVYKEEKKKWYLISDRYVSQQQRIQQQSESAFLLFYERIP